MGARADSGGTSGDTRGGQRGPSRLRPILDAVTSPRWLSRIVGLLGVVSLLSALSRPLRPRMRHLLDILPFDAALVATAATAAFGALLIVLAAGLRRNKHGAWWIAVGLTTGVVVLHLLKGLDVEESVLALVVLALLVAGRRHFTARPDPRSRRGTIAALVGGISVATLLGWGFLTLAHRREAPDTTAFDRLAHAFLGLVGVPGPVQFATEQAANRAQATLLVLGAIAIITIVVVALRPGGGPHYLRPDEEERVRELLARHGGVDSLSYFALRRDRSVVLSPTGKAAVSFRVVGGVSLAGGDPLGDPEAWPGAIEAWLDQARSFGWAPAVLGASEQGGRAYERAGLSVLEIGDEAVVDVGSFSLEGRPMRGVRQAVTRVGRAGYTMRCDRMGDLSAEELEAARSAADAWRDGEVERGFSMALGRFGDEADGGCVLVRALGDDGALHGILHFVPWGGDGLSLDLMRRDRASENGTVEAMVVALLGEGGRLGVRRVSLNFAVFRSVFERGERLGAGPVQRLERAALMWASRFWQIEALYRANAKYRPEWVPRFLCYGSAGDLGAVGVAALRAEAFITSPSWWRRARGLGSRDDSGAHLAPADTR